MMTIIVKLKGVDLRIGINVVCTLMIISHIVDKAKDVMRYLCWCLPWRMELGGPAASGWSGVVSDNLYAVIRLQTARLFPHRVFIFDRKSLCPIQYFVSP